MTEADILARVAKLGIEEGWISRDDEYAHMEEDALHDDVLAYIRDHAPEPWAGLARAALTSLDLDFARWYA